MVQVVPGAGNLGKVVSDHHGVKLQTFGLVDGAEDEVWKETTDAGDTRTLTPGL